jgi:ubiquinone/menaquinone biosynthesis C-methylase UbiE
MAASDRLVLVCDPSLPMMQVGRQRGHRHVAWLAGTGEAMPLADASVDSLTIAFGTRNVTHLRGGALARPQLRHRLPARGPQTPRPTCRVN